MTDLWAADAVALAGMLRSREVSAREVVAAHIDRAQTVGGPVNAIVTPTFEAALARAAAADEELARGAEPITAKRVRHNVVAVHVVGAPPVLSAARILIELEGKVKRFRRLNLLWGALQRGRPAPGGQNDGEHDSAGGGDAGDVRTPASSAGSRSRTRSCS